MVPAEARAPNRLGGSSFAPSQLRAPLVEAEQEGGLLNPVGWSRFGEGSHLLGIACHCGRALLVASRLLDSSEHLACPHCGADLR